MNTGRYAEEYCSVHKRIPTGTRKNTDRYTREYRSVHKRIPTGTRKNTARYAKEFRSVHKRISGGHKKSPGLHCNPGRVSYVFFYFTVNSVGNVSDRGSSLHLSLLMYCVTTRSL